MSAPLSYARECGPHALAALLGCTREEVAEALWPLRALWHDCARAHPVGGTVVFGTPPEALEDFLLRAGCGVDRYDEDAVLVADADVLAGFLGREAHDRVLAIRRAPQEGALTETPDSEPIPEALEWASTLKPLSEWLPRHRVGCWLYALTDGFGAHVVASIGPNVIAGDPEGTYQEWGVFRAYRIHPPPRRTEP